MCTQLFELSSQRRDQSRLTGSNEQFRLALEYVADGVSLLDDRFGLLFANEALKRLMGVTEAELAVVAASAWPRNWLRIGAGSLGEFLDRAAAGKVAVGEERRGIAGGARAVGVTIRRLDTSEGEAIWLLICRERRAPAADSALAAALKRAEEAARSKDQFLARMSHELRTPLNAILGMTNLVLEGTLGEREHRYLERVRQSGRLLLSILNDILDYSKIEAGRLELEHTPFRLDEVLEEVASEVALRAEEKGIEFVIHAEPGVAENLVGDPLRLSQILLNLATNAVKFTDRGEVVVSVRQKAAEASRVELEFTVRDSGIGMTPEQQSGLFNIFAQAHPGISRRYGGSGLGLVICKRLAAQMAGDIGVESRPGEGSTFTARVWLGRPEETGKDSERRLASLMRSGRVLVADPNRVVRDLLCRQIAGFGMRADGVGGVEEAISRLGADAGAGEYRLLLLDRRLAGLVQAADTLRSSLELEPLPVLLMVPPSGIGEGGNDYPAGRVSAVLQKPIMPGRLFEALRGGADGRPKTSVSAPTTDAVAAATTGLSGARILLVEDNEINQELAAELLRRAGAQVSVAGNGLEALELLRLRLFDGVLMDLQMPVLDGLSATRRIRDIPELGELPVIAMTADAMQGDRERCLAAGMNDYVSKPVVVEELYATLARWVLPPGN